MKTYSFVKKRIRYIVPFEYNLPDKSFEEICQLVDKQVDYPYSYLTYRNQDITGRWQRDILKAGEQDIYRYLIDEFSYTDEIRGKIEKSGVFFKYDLFKNNPFSFKYINRNKGQLNDSADVALVDMGMYIFRSGIGLMWLEAEANDIKDSSRLIVFENLFKEINRGNRPSTWVNKKLFNLPSDFSNSDDIPLVLADWIDGRLQFLNVSYQASRDNTLDLALEKDKNVNQKYVPKQLDNNVPDKFLMFTYAAFEKQEDWSLDNDAYTTAYYLTNGYKMSYKIAEDKKEKIVSPFSNVIWMATKEGCGYYAWVDEDNKLFFENNQCKKIMNDYFLLYIRALYQSYSLMKYATYTSKILPNDFHEYLLTGENTEILANKITELDIEINLFLVKSMVTSVSHIHHQNEFYAFLLSQLKIKEDAESVTAGLSALDELQNETLMKKQSEDKRKEDEVREIKEAREKRVSDALQIVAVIVTAYTIVSALTDGYSLITNLYNYNLEKTGSIIYIGFLAAGGIIILFSVIAFFYLVYNMIKGNKRKK